ncbi:MAG: response regulator [Candidatus Omnitrophica bacterium]|nr:response regulator [Candidatus Omnitrophota bacterium]
MNRKKRILIAEDERNVLKMTKARLEFEGYDVVTAEDGEEAIAQASSAVPIHLILLDIKLPKLNGYEVCRRLKTDAATKKIPVVIFTASESQLQHLANRCIEVGAADWVRKPFRSAELMAKIRRVLGEEGSGDA